MRGGALARVALDPSPSTPVPAHRGHAARIASRARHAPRVLPQVSGGGTASRGGARPPPDWCVAALHRRGAWPGHCARSRASSTRRAPARLPYSPRPATARARGSSSRPRHAPADSRAPDTRPGQRRDGPPRRDARRVPLRPREHQRRPEGELAAQPRRVPRPRTHPRRTPDDRGTRPGFLIDAPDAGAGKTLLARGARAHGRRAPPDAERWHTDEDEWAKVHLGNLLEGAAWSSSTTRHHGGTFGHGGSTARSHSGPWRGRILGQTGNVAVRNDLRGDRHGNNPRASRMTPSVGSCASACARTRAARGVLLAYRHRLPGDAVRDGGGASRRRSHRAPRVGLRRSASARIVPWGSFEAWAEIVRRQSYGTATRTSTARRKDCAPRTMTPTRSASSSQGGLHGGEDGASPTAVLNIAHPGASVDSRGRCGDQMIHEGSRGLDARRRVGDHNPKTLGRLLAKFEGEDRRGRRFMQAPRRGDATTWLVQELAGAMPVMADGGHGSTGGCVTSSREPLPRERGGFRGGFPTRAKSPREPLVEGVWGIWGDLGISFPSTWARTRPRTTRITLGFN